MGKTPPFLPSRYQKKSPNFTIKGFWWVLVRKGHLFSGGRGIRTPGSITYNSFQDCRVKPLCHSSGDKIIRFFYLTRKKMKCLREIIDFSALRKVFVAIALMLTFSFPSLAGLKAYLSYSTFSSPEKGA